MIAGFSHLVPTKANACSCGPITIEGAFNSSDVVFQAEVVAYEEIKEQSSGVIIDRYYEVNFRVLRSWKGIADADATARTTIGDCGFFPIDIGDQFLIYADGAPSDFEIAFNLCNSQRLNEGWSDDFATLNSIADPVLFVDEWELRHPPSMPTLCGSFGVPGGFATLILVPLMSIRHLRRVPNGTVVECFSKSGN